MVNVDFTASGRRLLSTITAKYDIAVDCGLTEAALLSNLHLSLDNGAFIYYLKLNSGLTSLSVRSFVLLKITPTHLPTAAPAVESSGTIIVILNSFLHLFRFCILLHHLPRSISYLRPSSSPNRSDMLALLSVSVCLSLSLFLFLLVFLFLYISLSQTNTHTHLLTRTPLIH